MSLIGPNKEVRGFFPAPLLSLDESTLEMDLYVMNRGATTPLLYRRSGLPFDAEDCKRLLEQGIEYVYIPMAQHEQYNRSLKNKIESVFADPSISAVARREVVKGICTKLMDDIMANATPEAMDSLECVSRTLASATRDCEESLAGLLDMSGHDFYTATHMMNVGIGCALLAHRVRAGDFVEKMLFAGFVHDIGKREIDPAILNKDGKLTDQEFDLIKRHPAAGVAMLRARGITDPIAIEVTRDHHERIDGRGYPRGISDAEIGLPARIAAIVDVYDALTSARPYRGPMAWDDAIAILEEGRDRAFDAKLLDHWRAIIQSASSINAEDLPADTEKDIALTDILPTPTKGGLLRISAEESKGTQPDIHADNRRQHPRIPCDLGAEARLIHANKHYPVEIREFFRVRVLDISRAGARVQTPWPLAIGDTIDLRAKLQGEHQSLIRAEVVRVRPGAGKDEWFAGCRFTNISKVAA